MSEYLNEVANAIQSHSAKRRAKMSNIETHVEELNREIAQLKIDLRKSKEFNCGLANENNSQQLEIKELKAQQVSVAAYAEQRNNLLKKTNDNLLVSNASLSSQVTRGVDDCNGKVDEINALKSALHVAVTTPMQPLINKRFKENKIVTHCLDAGGTDLNKICMIDFSIEDQEQFAQLIGYSLGGYGDLSYVTDESYYRAEKQSEGE